MDAELVILLALLFGLGVASSSSGAEEQPGSDVTAQQPSFFQLPDVFNIAAQPAQAPPAATSDAPYWFTEVQRRFPGLTIKVGPFD